MPALTLDIGGRDLAPGRASELSMQAWLVALDGQDEVRAALARQVLSVGTLGMHRIRGDHRPGLWGSNTRSWQ